MRLIEREKIFQNTSLYKEGGDLVRVLQPEGKERLASVGWDRGGRQALSLHSHSSTAPGVSCRFDRLKARHWEGCHVLRKVWPLQQAGSEPGARPPPGARHLLLRRQPTPEGLQPHAVPTGSCPDGRAPSPAFSCCGRRSLLVHPFSLTFQKADIHLTSGFSSLTHSHRLPHLVGFPVTPTSQGCTSQAPGDLTPPAWSGPILDLDS